MKNMKITIIPLVGNNSLMIICFCYDLMCFINLKNLIEMEYWMQFDINALKFKIHRPIYRIHVLDSYFTSYCYCFSG